MVGKTGSVHLYRENKTLITFLIFGMSDANFSGVHFPFYLPGLALFGSLLSAVGEVTAKPGLDAH